MSDLRVKSWKNLKICMQENRKDLSAIKRNEPFCSLDLTRYFLTEKKNLCQIKKWRELQKRKLDFSNESWVIPGQVQMWFRSRPKTRSPLRATLEIMLVFRQLGKIIRYFPDMIMNDEKLCRIILILFLVAR